MDNFTELKFLSMINDSYSYSLINRIRLYMKRTKAIIDINKIWTFDIKPKALISSIKKFFNLT